jgi:hypothetical protein
LIAALAGGDARRASALMDEHLEAVASRALIVARPPKSRELKDILSLYSEEQSPDARPNGGKRARRRR